MHVMDKDDETMFTSPVDKHITIANLKQDNNHYYGTDTNRLVYLFTYVPLEKSILPLNIDSSSSPIPTEFQPVGFWKIHCEGSKFITIIHINISSNRSFQGTYDTFMGEIIDCEFIGNWTFNSKDRLLQLEGQGCNKPLSIDITIHGMIGKYYYGTDNVEKE
jgi:hypothetical protein